jgi:hypothetical protein
LSGTIPAEMAATSGGLSQLTLNDNAFEGDLSALANHQLQGFTAHNNPELCGMVPVGARFAHGFNYYNTRLGLPC